MSHLGNFVTYFVYSFIDHKYLFIFVLLLTFSTVAVFWLTYDCSDIDQVYEDAYYDQETPYSLLDCLDIIVWNVRLNIMAYCTSFILGLGGIADTIINMGLIGNTYAATAYLTGDPLLFFKLTFVHGIPEDISTILNTFASMILGYFVLAYYWGVVKIRDASIESRLKESWEDNKIHLKQSLAVFIVGILVMIFAGVCEEFISVPIGNFVASL